MNYVSTILIVDDLPLGRETLEALLMTEGYHLAFASNGIEALEQAAVLHPDLILLDVMMPGMDGFEVCRQLRADPVLADIPVLMITALDDRESRLEGLRSGADDFISKPYDRTELRARVHTITRLNRFRRLMAERERFEWVVENAEDGYLVVDQDAQILYANPRGGLFLHLPEPFVPGDCNLLALMARDYRCEPACPWETIFAQASSGHAASHFFIRSESEDAPEFWLQLDVIRISAGKTGDYVVRLRDITKTVLQQREMWEFNAMVRHKLRTPLGLLVGSLELLESDLDNLSPADLKPLFGLFRRGGSRLRATIEDIFRFIDAPDMVIPGAGICTVADLATYLEEVRLGMELTSFSVTYQDIEDPQATQLALSSRALELILWELLENAKKFHPKHTPSVEILVTRTPEHVRLQVMDDGRTLAPEQLLRMWQPYYQVEPRFTGQVPGMGLGLPTVASILWGAGGSCSARNRQPGPGLVFDLKLPLVD